MLEKIKAFALRKTTKEFLKAAAMRAIRTFCQTMATMITVGVGISDINWKAAVSVSIVAAIYSLLTSFSLDVPEVPK